MWIKTPSSLLLFLVDVKGDDEDDEPEFNVEKHRREEVIGPTVLSREVKEDAWNGPENNAALLLLHLVLRSCCRCCLMGGGTENAKALPKKQGGRILVVSSIIINRIRL